MPKYIVEVITNAGTAKVTIEANCGGTARAMAKSMYPQARIGQVCRQ